MLQELEYNQKIFIEITNLEHGGQGWEIGVCLWSPIYDRGKSEAWGIMNNIRENDVIIHLVKDGRQYHWYGISSVQSKILKTKNQPPLAGNWSNMAPYQRINLKHFNRLQHPVPIRLFFEKYDSELRKNLISYPQGQFYVEYSTSRELRMAQRYVATCSEDLYKLFNNMSNDINFNPIIGISENIPTLNEPQNPDYNPPGRISTIVSRIIRDTKLSRLIKRENNWKCQICGNQILLPNGGFYAEGHHLKPLGGESKGLDIRGNIIILCPTHHAEFDYGSLAINPENFVIEHINQYHLYHGKHLAYFRSDLEIGFLAYHYENRFGKL